MRRRILGRRFLSQGRAQIPQVNSAVAVEGVHHKPEPEPEPAAASPPLAAGNVPSCWAAGSAGATPPSTAAAAAAVSTS